MSCDDLISSALRLATIFSFKSQPSDSVHISGYPPTHRTPLGLPLGLVNFSIKNCPSACVESIYVVLPPPPPANSTFSNPLISSRVARLSICQRLGLGSSRTARGICSVSVRRFEQVDSRARVGASQREGLKGRLRCRRARRPAWEMCRRKR